MPATENQPTTTDGLPPVPGQNHADRADTLTGQERAIVELEKKHFRYQGSKEQAIQRQLGLSPVAYYQQLNAMIDNPRVIAAEPGLMSRLRRHRDALS